MIFLKSHFYKSVQVHFFSDKELLLIKIPKIICQIKIILELIITQFEKVSNRAF